MSKELSPEEEEKLAARLGARLMTGKPVVLGNTTEIYLSGDETTLTMEDLRVLRDLARERRGA